MDAAGRKTEKENVKRAGGKSHLQKPQAKKKSGHGIDELSPCSPTTDPQFATNIFGAKAGTAAGNYGAVAGGTSSVQASPPASRLASATGRQPPPMSIGGIEQSPMGQTPSSSGSGSPSADKHKGLFSKGTSVPGGKAQGRQLLAMLNVPGQPQGAPLSLLQANAAASPSWADMTANDEDAAWAAAVKQSPYQGPKDGFANSRGFTQKSGSGSIVGAAGAAGGGKLGSSSSKGSASKGIGKDAHGNQLGSRSNHPGSMGIPRGDDAATFAARAAANAGGAEFKLYHKDVGDKVTTIMLKNVPNKYTRTRLIERLDEAGFRGKFDFLYLPIDFKNQCNVGYGFLNFTSPEATREFMTKFHNVPVIDCLPGFNSRKICEVTCARVQGHQDNIKRLKNSPVMSQLSDHPDWLPLLFDAAGNAIDFPKPEIPVGPITERRHKPGGQFDAEYRERRMQMSGGWGAGGWASGGKGYGGYGKGGGKGLHWEPKR
jgi:hypothetical protein